jgi:hypothetical protein
MRTDSPNTAEQVPKSAGGNGTADPGDPTTEPRRLPRWAKLVVSAALLYHITAVVIAPASAPPSSQLFRNLARYGYRYYLDALYLGHGYQFFAPEPGPSTLVSYTVTTHDGEQITERFPNTGIRPRLLYHRHFMLTERMWELADDAAPSYARHLAHKYDAKQVSLTRITHLLPTMEQVRDGMTLKDSRLYIEEPLGVFDSEGRRLP